MAARFASLTRDPETKAATLRVAGHGPWTLFNQGAHGNTELLLQGAEPGTYPLPDEVTRWTLFRLETPGGDAILAERLLPMAGGYNFRDVGGLTGAGGKHVRWGKLFRADDMGGLTKADLAYLASIPIKTVADFRTDAERAATPDKLPASVVNAPHLPVAPGHLNPSSASVEYGSTDAFMMAIYRDLALDDAITAVYRRFFSHVQCESDLPLLFHCSAGKDRTGFAAALILLALGVDKDTAMADYEASNEHLGDKYAPLIAANGGQGGLYTVKPSFLLAALDGIQTKYGSVETYLETALNVDIQAMRARYLF